LDNSSDEGVTEHEARVRVEVSGHSAERAR
jgi:hypothetical protein